MTTEWNITQKQDFINAMVALPPKEMHQIVEKIGLLMQDPRPDAKVKKQLKYMNGKLHRIRCGNYRIFYTFNSASLCQANLSGARLRHASMHACMRLFLRKRFFSIPIFIKHAY